MNNDTLITLIGMAFTAGTVIGVVIYKVNKLMEFKERIQEEVDCKASKVYVEHSLTQLDIKHDKKHADTNKRIDNIEAVIIRR